MRKIYNYLLLAVLLCSYSSFAQYVDNNWLEKIQFQDRFVNLKTTGSIDGSVYTAFVTNDLIRLGVKETDLKVTNGLYITKIGNEGEFKWVNYLEIFQESSCEVTSITNSADGALIYIAGNFYGQIDVNPDPQESNIISTKSWDYESFIVILEKDGGRFVDVYQFVPQDGGQTQTPQSVRINDIKVDSEGNLYGLGVFYGTVDFDPSAGVGLLVNPDMYEENIFAVKIDNRGRLVWAKRFAGDRRTYVNYLGLSVDVKGEVVVYGGFAYELNFLPDEKVILLSTNPIIVSRHTDSPLEFFFAKFNTDGEFMWAKHLPNKESVDPTINKLTTDIEQSIYFSGYFSGYGQIDVNPDPLEEVMLGADPGSYSGFVVKLDREGDFLWVNQVIAEINPPLFSDSYIADLDINEQGEVFFTGGFKGEIRFEDVNGEAITIASSGTGNGDAFVGKLNKEGKTAWMKAYNASASSAGKHVSVFENEYNLLGSFVGEVAIDKENDLKMNSSLEAAYFIISENEILNCSETYSLTRTYCGEPIVFGTLTITTPGIYTQIFQTPEQCDSIVTLTISPQMTPSLSFQENPKCFGETGQAQISVSGGSGNYTYRWLNEQGIVVSNTNAYTSALAGTYLVEVRDGFCIETLSVTFTQPNQIIIPEINVTPVSCASGTDGIIRLIDLPTGGAGQFLFTLIDVEDGNPVGQSTPSPTFSGLKSGRYYVRIIDANGCTVNTEEIVLLDPAPLIIQNAIVTNETCPQSEDGTISIEVSGGTAPYTVSLGQTMIETEQTTVLFQSLAPRLYLLELIDASGCETSPSSYEVQARSIDLNFELSNSCFNSEIRFEDQSSGIDPISWRWDFGDGSTPVFEESPTHIYTNAGTYEVEMSIEESFCTITTVRSITIEAPLQLEIVDSPINCFEGSDGRLEVMVLNAPVGVNFDYLWSTGSQESSINDLISGEYTIDVTHQSTGCVTSASFLLQDPTPINSGTLSTSDVNCFGESNGSLDFDVYPSGGTESFYFTLYSALSNTPINSQDDSFFEGLSVGEYYLEVSDMNNCTVNTNVVTINQPNEFRFVNAILTEETCPGNNDASILYDFEGGVAPYVINFNGDYITDQTEIRFENLSSGEYMIDAIDSNGCVLQGQIFEIESRQVAIQFSNPGLICAGSSASFNILLSGIEPVSYLYDFGDGTSPSTEESPTHTYANSGDFELEYTVYEVNCEFRATMTITVLDIPQAEIIETNSITCNGENDGELLVNPLLSNASYTYFWSNNLSAPQIDELGAGIYSVTITDNQYGCTNQIEYTLTQPDQEDPTFSYPQTSYCGGNTNPIPVAVTPNGVYSTFDQGIILNSNGEIDLLQSQIGTYLVTYTTPCNVESQLEVSIVDAYNELVQITICEGDSYTFNGDLLTDPGSYTADLQSQSGCDSTVTLQLSVAEPFDENLEEFICEGSSYTFDGNLLTEAGIYTASLQSQFGCDSTVTLNLQVLPSFSQIITASICVGETYLFNGEEYLDEDVYTLNLTALNGCDSTVTLDLRVRNSPELKERESISDTLTAITYDLTNLFTNASFDTDGYIVSIIQTPLNGTITQLENWLLGYSANTQFVGSDTIGIEVCACDGVCSTTDLIVTIINSSPVITIVDPTRIEVENQQGQDLMINLTDSSYTYDINQNIISYEIPTMLTAKEIPIIKGTELGVFIIKYSEMPELIGEDSFDFVVCDVFGECANGSLRISINPNNENRFPDDIVVYNAISPNNDGKHDYFHIENIMSYPDNRVVIFNRWGEVIYDVKNYDNDKVKWEGDSKSGNNKVPDGSYFYTIYLDPDKKQLTKKGYLYVKSEE